MIPKFRIWDKTNKEMLEWEELDLNKERGEDEITIFEPTGQFAHPIFFYDAMQSTGLKDDFGNELFEGDIFESRFSGIKYVVYWDDKLASFWIKGETKTHPLYTLTPFHPRILGNIYENPELLEDN
ncbi:hypothetical protein A3836_01325 [Staphylococcus hominis]|uniref:YopX family protein n=1 Tax=Staphylococcus hominis TaxID=1290 RepID=UPI0007D9B8F4|nr:YopX family protein [Staphylococcus hominis]OAO07836.1 hypothetical protein A3836_01325 [Staphylococcus hominis]